MTNTTTMGVTTLKKLQKECLTIDLTKVRFKRGYLPYRWNHEPAFDPNAPLLKDEFYCNDEGENLHIKFGGDGTRNGIPKYYFHNHTSGKWDRDNFSIPQLHEQKVLMFQGGIHGRSRWIHNNFTDAKILVDNSTDVILGVLYALDNDFLNEWLRETIDPSIPNNYEELQAQKEFEVLITTITFSQEMVKVVGRSYDECLETMKQNDPMLDVGDMENPFSGMKTLSHREGAKPSPSSYEEWVSLQEKEVA